MEGSNGNDFDGNADDSKENFLSEISSSSRFLFAASSAQPMNLSSTPSTPHSLHVLSQIPCTLSTSTSSSVLPHDIINYILSRLDHTSQLLSKIHPQTSIGR